MARMLMDATHTEEIRVVVMDENTNHIQDFEVETTGKEQIKSNIYVGEVSRVEPSLQAAFISYGGNRNGFLAFSEIHPSFFDLPEKEKKSLIAELQEVAEKRRKQNEKEDEDKPEEEETKAEGPENLTQEEMDEDARALALASAMADEGGKPAKPKRHSRKKEEKAEEEKPARFVPIHRRYNIADVLKEGQKILVQVVKEERGNKGAALTTYFSLPGRYTVLMPNTPYAGGISRKITDREERKNLKEALDGLKMEKGSGLIVRTAGVGQTKENIKQDHKNLTSLWKKIGKSWKDADGINCVHEDGNLVIRALRDMLTDEVEEIVIAGSKAHKTAKEYAKALMPDIAKKITEYKQKSPIFSSYEVEKELIHLHRTRVNLPSGGYLIINPTEALVAVDVNSGRNTQERNLEETAHKTNLEAAEEVARQVRLRDLSGLIVVDFIDMEDRRNERSVERTMRKAVRKDRARIQVGSMSEFGLIEISRQRLRPSLAESTLTTCPHCNGSGRVLALASCALIVLRSLEEDKIHNNADIVTITAHTDLAVYILNHKKAQIADLEARHKFQILIRADDSYIAPDHKLELTLMKADGSAQTKTVEVLLRENPEEDATNTGKNNNKRRGRNRNRKDQNKAAKVEKQAEKADNKGEKGEKEEKNSPKARPARGRRNAKPAEEKTPAPEAKKPEETTAEEKKPAKRRPARARRSDANRLDTIISNDSSVEKVKEEPKGVVVNHVSSDNTKEEPKSGKFQRWWSKG